MNSVKPPHLRKKTRTSVTLEGPDVPEGYWEEAASEEEWNDDVGNSSRKPSLDEYDRWDR